MPIIYLTGYMCCGKTTLGEAVARLAGWRFIDLDDEVERHCGLSVAQIFSTLGEAHFRAVEREGLRGIAATGGTTIVACGGGTPCDEQNRLLMARTGLTVWLTTEASRIAARLCLPEHKFKRPKIAALPDDDVLPYVRRELAAREPHYRTARLTFDSTRIEDAQETLLTARRLLALLQKELSKTDKE